MKTGIVAICDNVYKDEQTHKIVLAGLYSGSIVLEGIPSDLRLAFYLEVHLPDENMHELDLQFFVGGKQRGGAMVGISVLNPKEPATLIIPQFSIPVLAAPTTLEIRGVLDKGRSTKIVSKPILLRDPTA